MHRYDVFIGAFYQWLPFRIFFLISASSYITYHSIMVMGFGRSRYVIHASCYLMNTVVWTFWMNTEPHNLAHKIFEIYTDINIFFGISWWQIKFAIEKNNSFERWRRSRQRDTSSFKMVHEEKLSDFPFDLGLLYFHTNCKFWKLFVF